MKGPSIMIRSEEEETSEGNGNTTQREVRPQRNAPKPARFQGFEMLSDADVSADGNLVHIALFSEAEPINFEDAMTDQRWVEAMTEELKSIEKNQVWELVSQPKSKKPIDVKWIYKIKTNPEGKVVKYKARLVARGFLQKAGIDYKDVFAPIARIETIRTVVAIASLKN